MTGKAPQAAISHLGAPLLAPSVAPAAEVPLPPGVAARAVRSVAVVLAMVLVLVAGVVVPPGVAARPGPSVLVT